jgi:hypothetical protein
MNVTQNIVINTEDIDNERYSEHRNFKKALEKQGYRLIGSHSGVKLCRWTKVKVHSIFYAVLFVNYFMAIDLNLWPYWHNNIDKTCQIL